MTFFMFMFYKMFAEIQNGADAARATVRIELLSLILIREFKIVDETFE